MYLYNRWKSEAQGNLKALIQFLRDHADSRQLLRISEIKEPRAFAEALAADRVLGPLFRERFSHEGKKLLNIRGLRDKSDSYLRHQLTAEINLALTDDRLSDLIDDTLLSTRVKTMLAERRSDVAVNRQILDDRYSSHLGGQEAVAPSAQPRDVTVLDVLVDDALREDFVTECENLLLFDSVYDQIIEHLDTIAEEAESTRALSKRTITKLLDTTLAQAARAAVNGHAGTASDEAVVERLRGQFFRWFLRVAETPRSTDFFRAVEEWKKTSFPHLSDTLFVVVTFLFERLLGMHLQSEKDRRRYDGRISPRAIGRRKDFWNRLTIAYRDLRIQEVVEEYKGRKATGYRALIDTFFTDFEELYSDLLSSDPCEFPGFRISIESALEAKIPPCGIVTGIGTFNDGAGGVRVGAVISNIDFQAGAFDMASAEKFCKLLVDCAERQLPVIGFISSGGMQTKEGAGALFSMAAVNDRITRFVRDSELPVIMFGFGDCTGGAQASFVTHPLAQTYYFSGTNMPFAGQIVVPVEPPLDVDVVELPVGGARRDAGSGAAPVLRRPRRSVAQDRSGHSAADRNGGRSRASRDARVVVDGASRSSADASPEVPRSRSGTRRRARVDPCARLYRGEAHPRRAAQRHRSGAGAVRPRHGLGVGRHAHRARPRRVHRRQHAGRELSERDERAARRRTRTGRLAASRHRLPVGELELRRVVPQPRHQLHRTAGREHGGDG